MIDRAIYRAKMGVFLHIRHAITMAYLLLLDNIAERALRTERIFVDHIDLFAETVKYLIGRFRLPRHVLTELCDTLEPALRSHTQRSNPVPPHVQAAHSHELWME